MEINSNLTILLIGVVFLALLMMIAFLLKKHDVKTFLSDGVSMDESKVSMMAIFFMLWNFVAIFLVINWGDMPDNVLYALLGLGGGVVGNNIGAFSGIGRKSKEVYQQPQYQQTQQPQQNPVQNQQTQQPDINPYQEREENTYSSGK